MLSESSTCLQIINQTLHIDMHDSRGFGVLGFWGLGFRV